MTLHALTTATPSAGLITMDNLATQMWETPDVAEFLGVSKSALYDSVKSGEWEGCAFRVGKRITWSGPGLARRIGLIPEGGETWGDETPARERGSR